MTSDEQKLRERLRAAQQRADGEAPAFDATWVAAERRRNKRPATGAAVAAGIVALIAVAMLSIAPQPEALNLVDVEELVASTTWVAPSDSLLPQHRFDIFQELPELLESTGSEEGTLL
ncbi:MAG: hypothetical protein AAFN50_11725 [Pseudomonadota bacterium]